MMKEAVSPRYMVGWVEGQENFALSELGHSLPIYTCVAELRYVSFMSI